MRGLAVHDAMARFGHVDVLVNNAGFGRLGFFETLSPEQIEQQYATSVFGLFNIRLAPRVFARGTTPVEDGKRQIAVRFDRDVVAALKAGGTGLAGRMNAALRKVAGLPER